MHEKIKEFLDAKKAEERKEYAEKKQKLLIELGLVEKEYAPEDYPNNPEYTLWDDSENKWYKIKDNIELTDEEYEKLLKYTKDGTESNYGNSVATLLTGIAWFIYVFGAIFSLMFIGEGVFTGLIALFSTIVSGTTFLGFAKIIDLLDDIKNK